MSTQNTPPNPAGKQDAIDINDFVYAATGARVRRLTLPDGTHWFPAVDVAKDLGYVNTRQALILHVPEDWRVSLDELAQSVYGRDSSHKIAGHGLKRSMRMVSLPGLVRLVNGCTKPEAEPFKNWVTEVVVSIQRHGSYELEKAEVQPTAPDAPTAYAMPKEVADAIVRLEEHNLSMDAQMLAMQREAQELRRESAEMLRQSVAAQREIAEAIRESTAVQRESFTAGQTAAQALTQHVNKTAVPPRVTPASVIAEWRERNLVVTADIWAVAAYILPAIIEHGECLYPLDAIASVTGLTEHRVHDALRMLQKRGCVRQAGVTSDGAPVYVLK
ncbi:MULTISPECIES: Bro-N domain-containing protein [Streptomyces]|uniref:Bro-N domain-containing protein n=1 Tax=Streptomyces lonegramiae TaxID=3075524 RepID=A0ABU2XHY8_9ACTN|nr:Bro-N domain-containing protein [Streptomyces sp. DSM 41529]MDT0545544.1 Bro-N domain-containing protein [Streptomyces sp. DSM 41529]